MVTVAKKRAEKGPVGGFGAKLRRFREEAGLSQPALAERAGLSRLSVIRYETGASSPSWEVVRRLAELLGKTPNDFMD